MHALDKLLRWQRKRFLFIRGCIVIMAGFLVHLSLAWNNLHVRKHTSSSLRCVVHSSAIPCTFRLSAETGASTGIRSHGGWTGWKYVIWKLAGEENWASLHYLGGEQAD